MIHPINPNINNTAIYYGARLDADKNNPPKTKVTNSSASAAAQGDNGTVKTSVTSSSAREAVGGPLAAMETKSAKNITSPETIAPATASFNTPSVNIVKTLNAESEKEFKELKSGRTRETPALKAKEALTVIAQQEVNSPAIITMKKPVNAEAVISAYKH